MVVHNGRVEMADAIYARITDQFAHLVGDLGPEWTDLAGASRCTGWGEQTVRRCLRAALANGTLEQSEACQLPLRRGGGHAWRIELNALRRLNPPAWNAVLAWTSSQPIPACVFMQVAEIDDEIALLKRVLAEGDGPA